MAAIKFLFLLFYFYYMLKIFLRFFLLFRRLLSSLWLKLKVTKVFLPLLHFSCSFGRKNLQMFLFAFVSPHKLINILFGSFSLSFSFVNCVSLSPRRDNNIKNYCLTFICHLANIFSLLFLHGRDKKRKKSFFIVSHFYPL